MDKRLTPFAINWNDHIFCIFVFCSRPLLRRGGHSADHSAERAISQALRRPSNDKRRHDSQKQSHFPIQLYTNSWNKQPNSANQTIKRTFKNCWKLSAIEVHGRAVSADSTRWLTSWPARTVGDVNSAVSVRRTPKCPVEVEKTCTQIGYSWSAKCSARSRWPFDIWPGSSPLNDHKRTTNSTWSRRAALVIGTNTKTN